MNDEELRAIESAASLAIDVIEKVVHVIVDAKAGTVPPSSALKQITALRDLLKSNDAAVDSAIDQKFGTDETTSG